MFPLIDSLSFGASVDFVFAFVVGIGFGFALERAGFGNARKLALQFYGRDMTVFKVMFTAIVTAMTGLILLSAAGLLDLGLVYLNPTYLWPGLVGGLIMGFGFIIGGYCPGTSLVGLATGKIDAFYSVGGGLLGMFVFAELIPIEWFRSFYELETPGFAGRLTLYDWLGVSPGVVGFAVMLIAVGGFIAAEWSERTFGPAEKKIAEPETVGSLA